MTDRTVGLLDTSVFIAQESGRPLRRDTGLTSAVTSVITIAELQAGVLAASTSEIRARRLATLTSIADMTVLPVDEQAAHEWARLRAHLAESGRRVSVNDLWIAAVAASRGLPIVTQDEDFEPLEDARGVSVIRV